MLSHVSLGVSDLSRAREFYDAVLTALGFERVWTGERGLGYGPAGKEKLNLFPRDLFVEDVVEHPPTVGVGVGFHLAFAAPDREAVDRFHRAALSAGGRCNGAPGLRPHYGDTYYAAFVIDPDGHRLEAVHQ